MSKDKLSIPIKPVISYPRQAEVGKTYLMTVDLEQTDDFHRWHYEEEEYPIYCKVDTDSLFKSKPVGKPIILLHRFGGSYGAAKFLLTAAQEEMKGEIKITLKNGWGVPIERLTLKNIQIVLKKKDELTNLPEYIKLSNSTRLDLSNKQLTIAKLSQYITRLSHVTHLDLSNNQLTSLPEYITELSHLTELDLSGNQLSELPESITKLSNLTQLYLSVNQLSELPESISQLSNLTELYLSNNQLSELPKSISQLSHLTQLYLSGNQLSELPESITNLSNLTQLYLSLNQLSELPESITKLSNLTQLDLSNNQLSELPESISQLSNLTQLDLSRNRLSELPESISQLSNLTWLLLDDNPLKHPPLEIANRGIKAIKQYFQKFQLEKNYLYEAKLIIVGEAGAGKTTLAKKIKNPDYQLQEENSTQGIDVISWYFPYNNQRDFRVNIWDFGGQEIYHATHQFFLSKRSLYVLVVDARKKDTDFYYWLNIVELLSDNSPVLIIKNEKQDRKREINERGLRGQFTNIEKTLATNLKTNRGLSEILGNFKHYITNLPHIGDKLPKTWKQVREVLEQDGRNYISLEEYLQICQANGITERKYKLQLSGYLHDLGVFLHFQDDPLLNKILILKPEWATAAVYKVLDNDRVRDNLGKFTKQDLATIWQSEKYEDAQAELLQLMIKFKLCYQIPNTRDTYIAPQLLEESQPPYNWEETNNLIRRYTYEFMPKGIITQFIVAMHQYIWQQQYVWKSGVILEKDQTKAEVIEYYGKREIKIRVAGKYKRDLLYEVTLELNKIHDSYQRLKYIKLIPCNCWRCQNNQEPHFYEHHKLLELIDNHKETIQCGKSPYPRVNTLSLINDTINWRQFSILFNRLNINSKSKFQEFVQANGLMSLPKYLTEKTGGTDHRPEFTSRVYVNDLFYGVGKGGSKKEAEKKAADNALAKLEKSTFC